MNINDIVRIAKTVHDAEGWNLGTSSSRDQRNNFLERVCGIVHWGHPKYNLTPDNSWHCKDPDGPGGRPASDDVVVHMPDRTFYDIIPGAGADGYSFSASHGEYLPPPQVVFAPRKPEGWDGPAKPPVPPPVVELRLKPRAQFYKELQELNDFYASFDGLQRYGGMVINGRADIEALGAWGYNLMIGKTVEECKAEIRNSFEWKAKH